MFFEALAPAQVQIAFKAIKQLQQSRQALHQHWEQQLTQARYEVQLAQRQDDAVDPEYRLVAAELARRWNDQLQARPTLETAYTEAQQPARFSVSTVQQQAMTRLAPDLPTRWQASTPTDRERKQLLREAIAEVQLDGVTPPGKSDIRVTWWSGAVTRHQIDRLNVGCWAPRRDNPVIERLRALALRYTATEIREQWHQQDLRSAHGRPLQEHHVLSLARRYGITVTTCASLLPSTVP